MGKYLVGWFHSFLWAVLGQGKCDVEAAYSWMSKFGKLLVYFEKLDESHLYG